MVWPVHDCGVALCASMATFQLAVKSTFGSVPLQCMMVFLAVLSSDKSTGHPDRAGENMDDLATTCSRITSFPRQCQKSLGLLFQLLTTAAHAESKSWLYSSFTMLTKDTLDEEELPAFGGDFADRLGQFLEKCPICLHLKHFTLASSFLKSLGWPPKPRESLVLLIPTLVCFHESKMSTASCSSMGSSPSHSPGPSPASVIRLAETSWSSR